MDDPLTDALDDAPGVRDPEELEVEGAPATAEISPDTTMGPVHLTVSDLDRSIAYYEGSVGLGTRAREDGTASLGTPERELLVLVEEPGARPSAGSTGLYHFALLLPERIDLARWLAHAAADEVPLVGLSDHFVSEALYLSDPDGHGIEIYWDRPRETWEGLVAERMTTQPLDVQSLIAELGSPEAPGFDGVPDGTVMGHVHLKVAAIPDTVGFYRDLLGFGLMASLGPAAAFLSAGGYHHHLGTNTWESAGAEPPPAGSAALRHATVVLPDQGAREPVIDRLRAVGIPIEDSADGPLVRDPSGNAVVLSTASEAAA